MGVVRDNSNIILVGAYQGTSKPKGNGLRFLRVYLFSDLVVQWTGGQREQSEHQCRDGQSAKRVLHSLS